MAVANLHKLLRYVGVSAKSGYREYDFRVEDDDKTIRQVVLVIDDVVFLQKLLMFQEAPDLCYQKLKLDLSNEPRETPIHGRVGVTPQDVAYYRESHPTSTSRHKR